LEKRGLTTIPQEFEEKEKLPEKAKKKNSFMSYIPEREGSRGAANRLKGESM